jgi:hypothetical protein
VTPPLVYADAAQDEARDSREPSSRQDRRPRSRRDLRPWLFMALTLGVGAVFVAVDLAYNQGKLFAPLDDVYIHLQYGRQIGLGHFFQTNTGDPISTGASSLLYAVILGAAYAVGFHGTLLLAFAVGFGIVCWSICSALVYRLGTALVARSVGMWSALLVALSGPLAWGSSSGMEIGFTMMLIVATLVTMLRETRDRRFVLTPVVATLLAITRPEGLIFVAALCAAAWWTLWAHRREVGTASVCGLGLWNLLPLLAGAAQLLFYKLATGTMAANGVQAKSMLYDHPVFYPGEFVDRTTAHVRAFVTVFSGFSGQDFTFPGASLLFVVGLLYLLWQRPVWRPMLVAIGVGLAGVVLSVSTLVTAMVGNSRYVQPFIPVFLVFAVTGGYAATRLVAHPRARRLALHGALAVALLFSLVALPTWAVGYGRDTEVIRDSDVSVGAWVRGNLPPGAVVAVKDLGAVAYFGDHRVVDLVGLGTNGLAEASNNGVGTLYEALRHMPPGQRPDYFAVFETPPGPTMVPLQETGVLRTPSLATFYVQTPEDLNGNLAVPFRQIAVYRADWSLAGTGDSQSVPGQLRDYLNVSDIGNEREHAYRPEFSQVGEQPASTVTKVGNVIDSGRSIVGGEAFTANNLVPGRPLTITSRIHMSGVVPDMRVRVNGVDAGTWTRQSQDSPWAEYTFTVPGGLVTGGSVRIEVAPRQPLLNPYPFYVSYGYWFSQ